MYFYLLSLFIWVFPETCFCYRFWDEASLHFLFVCLFVVLVIVLELEINFLESWGGSLRMTFVNGLDTVKMRQQESNLSPCKGKIRWMVTTKKLDLFPPDFSWDFLTQITLYKWYWNCEILFYMKPYFGLLKFGQVSTTTGVIWSYVSPSKSSWILFWYWTFKLEKLWSHYVDSY